MSSCLGNPQSLAEEGTGVWAECLAGEEASCDGAEQGKWPERQGYLNQNTVGFGKRP